MVQAFRRGDSIYESAHFKLRGFEPKATYRLTEIDGRQQFAERIGQELMSTELVVSINEQPGTVVVIYQRGK